MVPDIYGLVNRKGVSDADAWFTPDLARDFSQDVARRLVRQLGSNQQRRTLRLSKLGAQCPCALWHSVNTPELAEPLPAWATIKYSYGHILEALAITLAKASGHLVVGEQDEVSVDGIVGHRDCVVDGCIVDVKSATSIGFQKFKSRAFNENTDSFGYLAQLDGYLVGSANDPLVTVKDTAYLLVIDKTLGHMCTYEHKIREDFIRDRIKRYKAIVAQDTPPACECGTRPDGQSGNVILDTVASYNPFKYCCFPKLRTFLFAEGPRYFTVVKRRPLDRIIEVDKFGKVVYN